jgi:hypothetical protein
VPPQRTFAEEVVEIVKGLTALSETPLYEIEIKTDGTLKVIPCAQLTDGAPERKLLEDEPDIVERSSPTVH